MKKLLIILIGIGVVMLILSSCDVLGVTIEGRIGLFESDLNSSDRSEVYTNFHPDMSSYNEIKDPDYWETTLFAYVNRPFQFSNLSEPVDSGDGQETLTANFSSGVDSGTCTFVMEQSGIDWLIRRFEYSGFYIQKSIQ